MDIRLPKIDGYVATKKIKELWPDIKIIAQTAYAMAGEKERCFECTTTTSGLGINQSSQYIVCGSMTKRQAEKSNPDMSVSGSGITVTVRCREQ